MTKSKSYRTIIIVVVVIVGIILLVGGVYQYNKITTTQAAYYAIYYDYDITQYNDAEKSEYQALLNDKETAFHHKNVNTLKGLNEAFKLLNDKVELRIKYEVKRAEIEAIHVMEQANEEERAIFNARKLAALDKVEAKEPIVLIDEAILQLKQTNEEIAKNVNARAEIEKQTEGGSTSSGGENNSTEATYSDNSQDNGNDTDGGISPPWGGGCSDLGNCWTPPEEGSVNW